MRGYPIRVEIGPKDIEAGKCVICRRDTREKTEVALEELETKAAEILERCTITSTSDANSRYR